MSSRTLRLLPVLLALALPLRLGGQDVPPPFDDERTRTVVLEPLPAIGSAVEERARDAQLRGREPVEGFLLRSPSSVLAQRPSRGLRLLAPEVHLAWNSRIPFSLNDGAMWAGKGGSALLAAGVVAEAGPLRLVVAPEVAYAENRGFDPLLPVHWTPVQRATLRPDWQTGRNSIDLPFRQGERAWTRVYPGQSSLSLTAGPLRLGAATESQWWGPGMRNAILLSNQAAGVPHLFVQTARPARTPLGRVEAKWIAGSLRGSRWSGADSSSSARSLSGAVVVLHPAGLGGLAVGAARVVYAPASGHGDALSQGAHVFTRWRGAGDSTAAAPFEQMVSLFGRLVLPGEGAEVYGEWARYRLPGSLRDLAEAPEHTQGYTLGVQWLRPARGGGVRLQGEHTYLEKSPTWRTRPIGSYYASAAVPEGYTHEGEVLGASVGPGGSGQWGALDWLRGDGRIGVFMGRIRWANDAYYDAPVSAQARYRGHDVSLFGGVRAGLTFAGVRADAEWAVGKRWNYLFQNYSTTWSNRDQAVNVVNHTLRLRLSAAP
ncbi:MAG TPA: capsule assembly Wzi family protein [Longimicrobium sp.]|nr:capsule assembly Wzi family protein [Longimicrobium sp.]